MKTIAFILTMMVISAALFVAQCVTFMQDHTFWEMVTSPIQFWTGKYAIAAVIISLLTNISVVAAVKKSIN